MKTCDECGGKHYAKGKCRIHYKMPSQLNPKPIKSKVTEMTWEQYKEKKAKKVKPITKISDKQKKINVAYKVLNKAYLEKHKVCMAQFNGVCTGRATELHHTYFGSNKRKHYLNETTFKALCSECHRHLHDKMDSDELVKLGLRILD